MNIGIKYCGGCNSHYDRTEEIDELVKKFPEHTFLYAAKGAVLCEVWLIVCGCSVCCAATQGLIATEKLFLLHTPQQFAAVVAFLQQKEEK